MEEGDIPSPPAFFRVCGHFTVFNPSRPMALAKLLEAAAIAETSVPSPIQAPLFDVPDLVGDARGNSFDQLDSLENGWPSLDRIRTHAAAFAQENDELVGDSYPDILQTENFDNSSVSRSSLSTNNRMIETPEGLALLLNNTSVQSSPPRRHVRWTSEEDDILRAAVDIEEGPPHNWKRIAKKYFNGTRNDLACKGRWNKVS